MKETESQPLHTHTLWQISFFMHPVNITHYVCVTVSFKHRWKTVFLDLGSLIIKHGSSSKWGRLFLLPSFCSVFSSRWSFEPAKWCFRLVPAHTLQVCFSPVCVFRCQLDCGWVGGELQWGVSGGIRLHGAALLSPRSCSDRVRMHAAKYRRTPGILSCLYQVTHMQIRFWTCSEAHCPFCEAF